MGYFATFSHVHNDRRTAVRLADDGRATLLITGLHGEVISSVDGQIDAMEAADIVADMMLVAPELPNSGGPYSFGLGEGEAAPQLVSFSRDQMPPSAFNLERRMREVIEQMRGQAPIPEEPRVRREIGMSPGSFAMWTGAFFAGHIGAEIVGLLALAMLAKAAGLVGLLLSLPIIIGLIGMVYWLIGAQFGKRYGRHADVWKPAMAAVVVPSIISVLLGGSFLRIGIAWLYPLIAKWGARGEV